MTAKSTAKETLAQFVRRVRNQNDWTLMDVARQCNFKISDGYISMVETGRASNPSPDKLKALADGLKVNWDTVLNLVLEKPSDLTPVEEELLATFRSMDTRAKADLLTLGRALRDARPFSEDHHIEVEVKPKTKPFKNAAGKSKKINK